jgi:hypothetical protein
MVTQGEQSRVQKITQCVTLDSSTSIIEDICASCAQTYFFTIQLGLLYDRDYHQLQQRRQT